jgi:DNA-binding protein YbaB
MDGKAPIPRFVGAVSNALQTAKKTQEEELGKVTAGMNLPGMM